MEKILLKINDSALISLFALRLALGWLFFYAGITKVFDPEWSAAGYLGAAKTFPALFHWFALPANIGWVNFLNEWGLTLVGVALLLGVSVRLASLAGAFIMTLYYLAPLQFPYPDPPSFVVDEHVIYALLLLLFAFSRAGSVYGLESRLFGQKRR